MAQKEAHLGRGSRVGVANCDCVIENEKGHKKGSYCDMEVQKEGFIEVKGFELNPEYQ